LVDIIRELPKSNRYNMNLVITDQLSKMIIAIPTNMDLTAYGAARLFRDHMWSKHVLPNKVISDRGLQFAAQFMKDLHKLMGVTANISTAYHPQTDGQTEHVNQEIE
jgi:transposase InsO family protein